MPKVLAVMSATVGDEEIAGYRTKISRRREHFRHAGCRYWVFQADDPRGAFMEFVEADDRATLSAALAAAPDRFDVEPPIYHEMEST